MLVQDLNGRHYNLTLSGHHLNSRNISKLHLKVRKFLKDKFPTQIILEEVPIEIYFHKTLFLDFFLPHIYLAVEAQGKQHKQFSSYFHHNKLGFWTAKKNDELKEQWCQLNDIRLVQLWEGQDDWWSI